jgi:hypothetical protein
VSVDSIVFLCAGFIAVVIGGAVLAYRRRLADWIHTYGEPKYGQFLPSYYGRSKPGALVVPGVGMRLPGNPTTRFEQLTQHHPSFALVRWLSGGDLLILRRRTLQS